MRFTLALLIALLPLRPAMAANSPAFYQGKTIQLVVNLSVGGPTDAEARLIARNLPRYIDGGPTIVVRNMPGAGGLTGVNYVGRLAQPDGMTLAYTSGVAINAALHDPALRVSLVDMPLVAIAPANTIAYMRSDYGGGVHRPEDILDKRDFWVAGLAPNGQKDLSLRMEMDLLGLEHHYLTGFPGGADIQLAIQRNEAQVSSESLPSYRMSVEQFVGKGLLTPLWYDSNGLENAEILGELRRIGAPSFDDFCAAHCRAATTSALYRTHAAMNRIGSSFLRMALLPPGAPPEAIAILRRAFLALDNDQMFREEAIRTLHVAPVYANGDAVDIALREAMNPGDEILDLIRAYIKTGEEGARDRAH